MKSKKVKPDTYLQPRVYDNENKIRKSIVTMIGINLPLAFESFIRVHLASDPVKVKDIPPCLPLPYLAILFMPL